MTTTTNDLVIDEIHETLRVLGASDVVVREIREVGMTVARFTNVSGLKESRFGTTPGDLLRRLELWISRQQKRVGT